MWSIVLNAPELLDGSLQVSILKCYLSADTFKLLESMTFRLLRDAMQKIARH
jgi:hypothetical protein